MRIRIGVISPRITVIIVLFALLFPSGFEAEAAKITLTSEPSGAQVRVLGVELHLVRNRTTITTPGQIDFRRVREPYQLQFSLADYETKIVEYNAYDTKTKSISVALEPLLRRREISLASVPEGAEVSVNGEVVGTTPVTTEVEFKRIRARLPWSPIDVVFKLHEYEDLKVSLQEDGDGEVSVELAPLASRVEFSFSSQPSGADLLIDGRRMDSTPFGASIRFTRRASTSAWSTPLVTFRKKDYQDETVKLTMNADRLVDITLSRISEDRAYKVRAKNTDKVPLEATISVDGVEKARTPGSITLPFRRGSKDKPWNRFSIEATIPGDYLPESAEITYEVSNKDPITFELEPITEVNVGRFFPILEMAPRGPRQSIDQSEFLGMLDVRDISSPASDTRSVTNFRHEQPSFQSTAIP